LNLGRYFPARGRGGARRGRAGLPVSTPVPLVLTLMLFLALAAAGCGGGGGGGEDPGRSQARWTFLVYINGANDLEPFSGLNLNQMEQVGSTGDVNIVVQVKRIANRYDRNFPDWNDTEARRFYVTKDADAGRIRSQQLGDKFAADMGKPETLRAFVDWGVANYPADRLCLVIWNHGAGWRKVRTGGPLTRGVSYDDTTGSHIDTIALPNAVALPGGRRWDVLAFDSSLMQMAEVAYEIRNQARFIVGSEESPPGEGYPYHRFLARLVADPDMDGRTFGGHIVDETIAAYGPNSDITHSVLDASNLDAIAPALNALAGALLAAKDTYGQGIMQARELAENYSYPQNRDLIDFTELLLQTPVGGAGPRVNDAGVRTAVDRVQAAVRAAVVKNVNGSRHPRSNGLSIFLPSPSSYRLIDDEQANGFGQRYGALALTQAAPQWQEFLIRGPQ
jgi:hypothetical protein